MALTDVGGTPVIQTGYSGYEGGFGSQWVWAFLLFALLGGGGFGWGRNNMTGAGVAAVDSAVYASQQFNQLDNGIRAVQNGICSSV